MLLLVRVFCHLVCPELENTHRQSFCFLQSVDSVVLTSGVQSWWQYMRQEVSEPIVR